MRIAISLVITLGVGCAFADQERKTSVWQPPSGLKQLPIWPGAVPDARPFSGPETLETNTKELVAGRPWLAVGNVSQPTITVFPPKGKNTGAAAVVFPGGGYWILAIDLEGTEVCDWLTSKGITAILLKYRVPGDGKSPRSGCYPNSAEALQDAQRTLSLVRFHAAQWKIDSHKIGAIGFSAGGHLVAATSTLFDKRVYKAVDAADKESCRPDFGIAVFPGHLLESTTKDFELNPYVPVSGKTPPTLLIQAEDDPVDPVENSLVYFEALKKAGVPAEIHVYAHGGHAFGLRRTKEPITAWPQLAEAWLQTIGVVSK
jgi:acetyl esterase/lipase